MIQFDLLIFKRTILISQFYKIYQVSHFRPNDINIVNFCLYDKFLITLTFSGEFSDGKTDTKIDFLNFKIPDKFIWEKKANIHPKPIILVL